MIRTLTKLILAVIVLFIIIFGLYFLYGKVYSGFRLMFEEEKIIEKEKSSLELFNEKLNKCELIDDFDCLCDTLVPFSKGFEIEINNQNKEISIKLGKKIIEKNKFTNPFFIGLATQDLHGNWNSVTLIETKNINIGFDQGIKINKFESLSNSILKSEEKNILIALAYPITLELKKELMEFIRRIEKVKCINYRLKAIAEFEKLKKAIEKKQVAKIDINLPVNFLILIEKNKIKLIVDKEDKEEVVNKLEINKIEIGSQIKSLRLETKEMVYEFKKNLLCEELSLEIKGRSQVEIKKIDEEICIKKI